VNPVDAFIDSGLTARGLARSPEADKATLLRRATYSVTGLPPSEREMRDFLADDSPAAWEQVVDRLLASPHYGEHWARHWLDLVRYAETNSFERDGAKPHVWRYRDYVIRSFNDDKPYDQFVLEQLAGDELPDPSGDALIATGYYRLGLWDDEPADKLQARYDWLDDIVSTTGQVFLGLTINCARCHDHKLDPITQEEYFRLWAVFAGVRRGDLETDPAESKRIAAEKSRLSKALAATQAQITKLAGEGLALAKLLPEASGIDIRNGSITKDKLGYFRDIVPNKTVAVPAAPSAATGLSCNCSMHSNPMS
jgi:hypothetical protein